MEMVSGVLLFFRNIFFLRIVYWYFHIMLIIITTTCWQKCTETGIEFSRFNNVGNFNSISINIMLQYYGFDWITLEFSLNCVTYIRVFPKLCNLI